MTFRKKQYKYADDFAGFCDDCEKNYARITRLLSDSFQEKSLPASTQVNMAISVISRHRYTTTIRLSAYMAVGQNLTLDNQMDVNLYHDARVAEVVRFDHLKMLSHKYGQPNDKMLHSDEKTQLNRLLGDWLIHCANYGYASAESIRI